MSAPGADDSARWFDALYGVIGALWLILLAAYAKLWTIIATREWVEAKMAHERENDDQHDRQLIADKLAPVIAKLDAVEQAQFDMHKENRALLHEILRKIAPAGQKE